MKYWKEYVLIQSFQYFVATLCDLKVDENRRKRIGIRYPKTPGGYLEKNVSYYLEVQCLIQRLKKTNLARQEIFETDPSVIISVLKQILTDFPGGIFDDQNEEFLCVSLKSPLEVALAYVHDLVGSLPIFLRQFTFLLCKSLKNLAQQSAGSLNDSYTG
jgi:hypothetical protein